MHSLRSKFTLLTVCSIVAVMLVVTILGIIAIRNLGKRSAEQMLLLLCEAGEKNLDSYFDGVEKSVEMVSAYVEEDLDGLEDEQLQAHLDRVSDIFRKMTYNTNGILTYYYRIDPEVSENVTGFWYVKQDGTGDFQEHEVTDITEYDLDDTSQLVWFTVPRATGEGVWLPPYITENLDARVISYNVPVYLNGQFVGVIGIELDYSTMAEQVDNITLYDNGYAFINDEEGAIIYHPRMDVTTMETQPKVPAGLLSDDEFITYDFEGVEKEAVWLPLENGMRLNVTVPVSEINEDWQRWIMEIIIIFAVLLAVIILLVIRFSGRITKPLRELTEVAKQVKAGNYDCRLDYNGNDEVGILTDTFNDLTTHLKSYIGDLNDLAYHDALTHLRNKGAFDIYVENIQQKIDETGEAPEFAICIFDCNRLKCVNDNNGHEKGNIYLKESAAIICEVFKHSPVFRVGGDEFAVILMNIDYREREELMKLFDQKCREKRSKETESWEQVDVARGMAVYDPDIDETVNKVVHRADQLMYENKRAGKEQQANT